MLTWLRDQVLALSSRISQVLSSAYSYARDRASSALESAKAWARSAIDSASAALSSAIASARALATSLYNSALAFARVIETALRVVINLGVEAAKSLARSLYNAAVAAVEAAKVLLKVLINLATDAVRAWVVNLAGGVAAWWNGSKSTILALVDWFKNEFPAAWGFLTGLIKLLSVENLRRLADLLNRIYLWFVNFLEDPIGYIAAFVLSFFIPMLCDEIAQAMGTVKYTLPPPRTYGKNAFGGGGFGGTGPPPGASGLAAPLDRMYVSGYRFGPGHPGIDLGLTNGAPVYACHDGVVTASGWSSVGYGFTIVLEGGGWRSRYAHLSAVGVGKGDRVGQRDQIGKGDSTGNSTGPHLHLELSYNGSQIDPVRVLPIG
jgi:hypothetical protein